MDTELICEVLHVCVIMKGTICSLNRFNAILGSVSISSILSEPQKKKFISLFMEVHSDMKLLFGFF